jgi:hypothetical protein
MTRANFEIITAYSNTKLQRNGDGYPSNVLIEVFEFVASVGRLEKRKKTFFAEPDSSAIASLIDELALSFGHVGNFSYYYEINFVTQTVKVWEYETYWKNAPADWKEKGWQGVYENKGKFGYTWFRKGAVVFHKRFGDLISFTGGKPYVSYQLPAETA